MERQHAAAKPHARLAPVAARPDARGATARQFVIPIYQCGGQRLIEEWTIPSPDSPVLVVKKIYVIVAVERQLGVGLRDRQQKVKWFQHGGDGSHRLRNLSVRSQTI